MKKILAAFFLTLVLAAGASAQTIPDPGGGSGGSGDLTEVQVTAPIEVTSGTGPIPVIACSTCETTTGAQTKVDTHVNDTSAAHAASAISADSTTLVGTGTDVQAVLEELDNGIADHLADATDAHNGSALVADSVGPTQIDETAAYIWTGTHIFTLTDWPIGVAPAVPAAGYLRTYASSSGNQWCVKDSAGVEKCLGASGATGLTEAFGTDPQIRGATEANPFKVCNLDASICAEIFVDDLTSSVVIRSNPTADERRTIPTDKNGGFFSEEHDDYVEKIDPDAATPALVWTYPVAAQRPRKSIWLGAERLYGDGTQCPSAPSTVTINSGAPRSSFICTDNDAASLYGETPLPDAADGDTITVKHYYVQTAADTGVLNGDVAASCRLAAATINNTWGTEVAIDDAAVTGSNALDITESAAVTPNGTCTAGASRLLQIRYQLDATGTTTAVATLHHLGFMIEYTVSSRSD